MKGYGSWVSKSSVSAFVAVLFLSTILIPEPLKALPQENAYMGPLAGRNMYAAHLGWFSFPAETARAEEAGSVILRSAFYFLNEFSSYPFDSGSGDLSPEEQESFTALDYESSIWEAGIDWQINRFWRLSADWRLHSRYGGYLDSTIEWWHSSFGLANAGREFFPENRSYWNIRTADGHSYKGSETTLASGDLDFRAHWSFYSGTTVHLATSAALKLPTGNIPGGFGSGYPDFALAVLVDWQPDKPLSRPEGQRKQNSFSRRWVFFANAGLILPTGPSGRLMWQFIPAVEFRINPRLSILAQMNLQRSPITGDIQYEHPIFGNTTMFSLPQTDIKIGLKGESGLVKWQIYIEEDPLSWEGPDILVYFGMEYRIR